MGTNCFGERKRAVIDWRVSNHSQVCSIITGRFREALQDARSDSGEQGIISDSRKKIKGQEKITGSKDKKNWENGEELRREEMHRGIIKTKRSKEN